MIDVKGEDGAGGGRGAPAALLGGRVGPRSIAAPAGRDGSGVEPSGDDDGGRRDERSGTAPVSFSGSGAGDALRAVADAVGLRTINVVAWRDLDDPEAGGSELHAHRIATQWASAGLDVTVRTSAVPAGPAVRRRSGYRAVRRGGRYSVFPAVAAEGLRRRPSAGEGLVEIWNGMPFFSSLWFRGPRVVFLHHVHAEMWGMVLPRWMAIAGEHIERTVAPRLYRGSRVVTLSASSRDEIVSMLGLPAERISVVPPGVEERFAPGGSRSPQPLVVAVGRLVPVKRFDLLLESLAALKSDIPALQAVIIGEGFERPRLEAVRHRLGADDWIQLPGRLSDAEVVDWYRRAWVVAATSLREGWGMTLSEAAACGTPAVATRIAGHADAVRHEETGLLADGRDDITRALAAVLRDAGLRQRLSRGATEYAATLTWEATARATLEALAGEMPGPAPPRGR
jgi:glycosyltransferase involved in cell wall biosynthesis